MLSVVVEENREEDLPCIVTQNVLIVTRMRLEPRFVDDMGTQRWTTPTDHTPAGDRKMRLHDADSALQARQCALSQELYDLDEKAAALAPQRARCEAELSEVELLLTSCCTKPFSREGCELVFRC